MKRGARAEVPESAHFAYQDGELACDGVPLHVLAEAHGTPSFVYSAKAITTAYHGLRASVPTPHLVAYAAKACSNLSVLRLLANEGCGCDIVSGGELARALEAGVAPDRIVFSGVGKTDAEIRAALEAKIRAVHVESAPELDAIEAAARSLGVRAPITLRINPDVDPATHPYIATGLHDSKFGLELDAARALLPRILASDALRLEGVACHIGSQLPEAEPLADAVALTAAFALECRHAGAPIRSLDAGGGWPIRYGDEEKLAAPWGEFGLAIRDGLHRAGAGALGLEVIVEPGRALVGDAAVLLTRVVYVKEQAGKRFVIVDAAMSELIRPALYDAYHAIVPVRQAPLAGPADVVGPICETGDFFALDRPLAAVRRGDLLAIRGAGAYGMSMASNYNSRPFACELLVEDGAARVIRRRQSVPDLWRDET
ncbi:MAG: diaminopimelate decarboxylase [Sandaracinaceae bacterium]|nr:diaminopimelate decarboxylase [Sandaracinaceae bacterium]